MRMKSTLGLVTMAASAFAFALTMVPGTSSAQESTWDRIKKSGKLNAGCIIHIPYWYKARGSDEWVGWAIEGTKQMAKDLAPVGVKGWQCEMTTWGTAALGIQSGKVDYLFAMQATPIRATAITFAGPLYNHGFMTVNNKNFKGRIWADYDKPEVRIAVIGGTSTAMVRRFVAPHATAVELPKAAEVPLSVIAGRADAMITTVINGVVAKQKNPDMGDFVIPTPIFSFPAYVGVANEPDKRFRDFVHWWAEWYRLRGEVETWVKDSLVGIGIDKDSLPDKFYF